MFWKWYAKFRFLFYSKMEKKMLLDVVRVVKVAKSTTTKEQCDVALRLCDNYMVYYEKHKSIFIEKVMGGVYYYLLETQHHDTHKSHHSILDNFKERRYNYPDINEYLYPVIGVKI